ncbi:diguanylate cyclase [Lyngbya sp. PCC 8106]|uniref:GGDEF domain-containing protein n=1 Tax=Lyngbya sp. (strain PCC 8106) TaxID=313612 RepID=UPI0000EACECE|nr:diguanylate cyclase [Lyngbya sp. PCC 8106]EAW36083.1 Putative diguanylate cyclase/phosphodiesterase (GGDEF & EAL domains) with Phytochrome (GAF) sensor [Lyngbya sp. PCC 8106]
MNQQTSWETQCYQLQEHEYVLGKISYAIYRKKNLQDILDIITTNVQKIIRADRILIYHKPVANLDILLSESLSEGESLSLKNILYSSWNFDKILHQLEQGTVCNPSEIDESIQAQQFQLGIKSELIVPILVHNHHFEETSKSQLWGMLVIHQRDQRHWQPFEVNFLNQMGMQVAIAIQQVQLSTQLKVVKEQLKQQKIKDDLTQISNRRYFDKIIEIEWKRLERESCSLSLILCQVDGFEHYHQIYGSAARDSCLQLVAAVLLETAKRPADLVARYDQEIFAILLPNTHLEGAVKVAEAIRTRVKLLQIPHQDSPMSYYVTMSLGATSVIPTPIQEVKTLIQHSEKSLEQAKKDGDRVLVRSDF